MAAEVFCVERGSMRGGGVAYSGRAGLGDGHLEDKAASGVVHGHPLPRGELRPALVGPTGPPPPPPPLQPTGLPGCGDNQAGVKATTGIEQVSKILGTRVGLRGERIKVHLAIK